MTETVVVDLGARRAPAAATPHQRLADLAAEWLGLIVALRGAGKLSDPAALRTRVLDLKTGLEGSARDLGFAAPDVEAAVYALVAFTDETVLSTQGAARDPWQSKPLQLELYGRTVAGREFFERLDRLRRDRETRIEALEVYHTCLALGFAGQYSLSGPEKIQALLDEVWRDIAAVRRGGHGALSPHGIRKAEADDGRVPGIPLWLSLAVFVPAVMLVWLVVFLLARHGASGTAAAIRGLLAH